MKINIDQSISEKNKRILANLKNWYLYGFNICNQSTTSIVSFSPNGFTVNGKSIVLLFKEFEMQKTFKLELSFLFIGRRDNIVELYDCQFSEIDLSQQTDYLEDEENNLVSNFYTFSRNFSKIMEIRIYGFNILDQPLIDCEPISEAGFISKIYIEDTISFIYQDNSILSISPVRSNEPMSGITLSFDNAPDYFERYMNIKTCLPCECEQNNMTCVFKI